MHFEILNFDDLKRLNFEALMFKVCCSEIVQKWKMFKFGALLFEV